ncbi:family 10 glycosylhydrolase [Streptomyces sp. A3M-1-3]|uniref:glycoside hydrolase family 10 protein n=1 Tax=Streptomyces sp. A3M-1-3 TaxID=2962044 RepID=UPI0020B6D40E|nr:family 10 glycosylhydrolase [Streptomyces sp. A3M-1-3]MCP3817146.1 family 10 glycosylhydrolase [Streptomyces sp. A3M-1-3]
MKQSRCVGRRGLIVAVAGALSCLMTAADAAAARPRQAAAPPPFRAMWLACIGNRDWPSRAGLGADQQRAELLGHLDTAVARRLNAVILQVRPSADSLWPSPYEPWAECLTGEQGVDPGWDPLGTAVTEAHRRGLELHAWFNPYRVANHTDLSRLADWHPARVNEGWAVRYGGKLFYNPGLPEVRRFVQDAMLDAVRRYAIDAVHWDDYFYPYPVAGQTFDDDEAYALHGGDFPDRAAWRRHNTDLLVLETCGRVKDVRKDVRFGISPFGVWRNVSTDPLGSDTASLQTYDALYADTRKWVKEGWIDYVVPQLYWHIGHSAADYAKLLPWWSQTVRGTEVSLYIGEALYKAGDPNQPSAWQDPAELSSHLTLGARYPEVGGHAFFSAKEVAADRIGAMARVVADHYRAPAGPSR